MFYKQKEKTMSSSWIWGLGFLSCFGVLCLGAVGISAGIAGLYHVSSAQESFNNIAAQVMIYAGTP
jgi:hypothetical protein